MRSLTRHAIVCLAVALGAFPAGAQEEEHKVVLHGFGSWAYGRTDANAYLSGLPDGNYRNISFLLHVSASVSDRLRIASQLDVQENEDGSEVEMDSVFAEWTFSDRIKLRAGKVNQPFGISTEVFDVGTLRPFLALPQAFYGPIGLNSEAYEGIGFTGSVPLSHSWDLSYDVYGGGTVFEEFVAPEAFLEGEPLVVEERETTHNVIGGRIVVETPLAGLRFGASALTGTNVGSNARRSTTAAEVEYLTDTWSARTEYGHQTVGDEERTDGFYVEVAYRIDPRWQVAGQYGRLTSNLPEVVVTTGRSLLTHEELALGVNYWFHPAFVCKLAYHHVDGNRFAAPDLGDLADLVASGRLQTRTNLVAFGFQFSF
jgi:phosphate-selective porin O/P